MKMKTVDYSNTDHAVMVEASLYMTNDLISNLTDVFGEGYPAVAQLIAINEELKEQDNYFYENMGKVLT